VSAVSGLVRCLILERVGFEGLFEALFLLDQAI
jgi:hypothetical protein